MMKKLWNQMLKKTNVNLSDREKHDTFLNAMKFKLAHNSVLTS